MNREAALQSLAECRVRIDALDRRILDLLNERARVVDQIADVKRASDLPIYEPKREEDVLKNIADHNAGPIAPDAAQRIFERIIDEMRNLQRIRMEAARDGE